MVRCFDKLQYPASSDFYLRLTVVDKCETDGPWD